MEFKNLYRLRDRVGEGVYCGPEGLFVGKTPLLEKRMDDFGRYEWRVRGSVLLEVELAETYGLDIDFNSKALGVRTVAKALSNGDRALA